MQHLESTVHAKAFSGHVSSKGVKWQILINTETQQPMTSGVAGIMAYHGA